MWCWNLGICYQVDPKVPVGRVCPDNTWRDRFPSGRISGIKFAYKRVIYGNTPKFVSELYLDSAKFRVWNNIFIFTCQFPVYVGHNYENGAKRLLKCFPVVIEFRFHRVQFIGQTSVKF